MPVTVARSYIAKNQDGSRRVISETPFDTMEEALKHINEMVELNPGVKMDFFITEK